MADDPRFRIEVTYGPGNTNIHDDLTESQVQDGAYAFTHDMATIGSVQRLVIERKPSG